MKFNNIKRICFVCLGNICRSPMAEAIFKSILKENNLEDLYIIDSAGITDWNIGENADPRAVKAAYRHGIEIDSVSKQFLPEFFVDFDIIISLDNEVMEILKNLSQDLFNQNKVHLLNSFSFNSIDENIPDPYYGNLELFEEVFQTIRTACYGLFDKINEKNSND